MSDKKTLKEAAALKYDAQTDSAPVIVGLGQGYVAETIIKTAKDNAIPVVEDKTLAHLLNKLSVGDEIPDELYQMVAQVLVFVTNLDKEYGNRFGLKKV